MFERILNKHLVAVPPTKIFIKRCSEQNLKFVNLEFKNLVSYWFFKTLDAASKPKIPIKVRKFPI